MKAKVRYHDLFQSDVDAYIDWFDEARAGLGADFAVAVKLAMVAVVERPLSHAYLFEDYRRALISRFRVVIPFLVDGDIIYVAGAVHGTRDLKSWLGRRALLEEE